MENKILLEKVANLLGDGWKYHQTMSENSASTGDYLYNKAGLYINVKKIYAEKLPRWSLGYRHPVTHLFCRHCYIGCSFDKSVKAIADDVKNRLLSDTKGAYSAMAETTEKEMQKQKSKEMDALVVESLKKVLRLNPYYDHRFGECYRIENDKGTALGHIKRWASKGDNFNLDISNVTAEQVIKIMSILKNGAIK